MICSCTCSWTGALADEQTRVTMITQAREKHRQMRSYVDGADVTQTVVEHIRGILRLHPTLAIRHVVDIDHGTQLSSDIVEHLGRAVDTALANVGQHAPGADVVVTLRSDHDRLVVNILDNGSGFDPAASRPGYGIAEILGRQLELVGGRSVVRAVPGSGTDVSITVPRHS
jgi:signal transduction histidine kinase